MGACLTFACALLDCCLATGPTHRLVGEGGDWIRIVVRRGKCAAVIQFVSASFKLIDHSHHCVASGLVGDFLQHKAQARDICAKLGRF